MENEKIYDIQDRTYKFSLQIIKFVRGLRYDFVDQIIVKQLIRSATNIGANVAEGKAGSSKKDFVNYYLIALKSANETIYWLELLRDSKPNVTNEELIDEANQIAKVLAKIVINTKK